MIITVEVTQSDIDSGEMRSCSGCPLAIAISRATGRKIDVGSNVLYDGKSVFPLPAVAIKFRETFDRAGVLDPVRHGHVSPFSFSLEVPDSWIRGAA